MLMVTRFLFVLLLQEVRLQQIYNCPESWETFQLKCYQFVFYHSTYDEAKLACGENGASLVSVNTYEEHSFISQWLIVHDISAYRWYTSGYIYDLTTGDLSWKGDGTKIQPGQQYWLNEAEKNKQGRNIVYTYGVLEYGWGVEVGTNRNPYICEISQQEVYRVVNEQRDFDYGTTIADPNLAPRGPKFIIQPRSIVAVGSVLNAEFECIAIGLPSPTYTILKIKSDGSSVALSSNIDKRYTITNGKLSIQNPNDGNDTALYHCIVENQFGRVLGDTMQLSFGSLGEFPNTDRAPVNANAHEYAIINCLPPIHSPALTYQWYHADRGEFIMTSLMPHIFISRNGKLYFSEVALEDAGNYRCIVKLTSNNGAAIGTNQPPSRTSRPIPLNIQNQIGTIWGPEISNDFPASFPTTPKRGQNVYIECLAFGTVPITYYWTRKGLPLPTTAILSDHNRLLTIQNVQIEDSGIYICHASRKNTANAVKEFSLTVESEPYFSFPLMDKHVDIGSQLTWRCEAKAIPSATYHWYVNGTLLQPNNVDMVTNRNVLIIKNLDPIKHNGMYQCGATNTHGTTFTSGQLRVLAFAPTFMKSPLPSEVYGALNGNATIICNPEAAPTPEYKWLKNNVDMGLSPTNTGSRIRMLANGNLFFTNINNGDAAFYSCSVTNLYGSASSSTKLTVSSGAVISVGPVNTEVRQNNTAFINCQGSVSENDDYVYTWTLNGQNINIENDLHYTMGSTIYPGGLYVRIAQYYHAGYYECTIQTTHGKASAGATLTVQGPPVAPSGVYVDTNSITATTMYLKWTPQALGQSAYYIIEYRTESNAEWATKVQVSEASATAPNEPIKRTYTLTGLSPGNGYVFRVRAGNTIGYSAPSLASDVYQTPMAAPVKSPLGVGGGGGSVGDLKITWIPMPQEDQGGTGIGYNIYWRKSQPEGQRWQMGKIKVNGSEFITQIGQENYYSLYDVKVQAFNDHGIGPNSTSVRIYSAEDLPVAVVTNANAWRYNSTACKVTWDIVPDVRETMKGTILGYQVNYWEMYTDDPIVNSISWRGQMSENIVIGLLPNTWYTFDVQVFNTAGMSTPSETAYQRTLLSAPLLYPTEVHVTSHGSNSVSVYWRGVSTGANEEPLQGYKLRYWINGDDIRTATDLTVGKATEAVIYGLQKDNLYNLRVLGYSRGGDGNKGNTIYFTLGGQVSIDPEVSEIRASGQTVNPCITLTCLCSIMYMFTYVQ